MQDHAAKVLDLRLREVINIHDGTRYGFVSDAIMDLKTGRIADADRDFIRSCDDWDYDLDSWSVLD